MKTITEFNIEKLVRPNILKLNAYQSAREAICDNDSILLDANENPFPLGYNRYPDPFQRELKKKIGVLKKISPENFFLGNGSDEIIDLLIRAFCIPGEDSILVNVPTYGMYEVCARINDINVIKVELNNEFQLDLQQIIEKGLQAKIIFICSPNNPTGNIISRNSILNILDRTDGLVVIDEAYIDFANDPGFVNEIKSYSNLIVLQTFSKAKAMAGIRLGMGFMNTEIVKILNKIKYPYNISTLNQNAATQAIDKQTNTGVAEIIEQREWLTKQLSNLSIVEKIWPSDANFLLVQFQNHRDIFEYLKKEGIIVRDRSKEPKCEACLRITVGKSLDNLLLITCLKQFQRIKMENYEKNIVYGS